MPCRYHNPSDGNCPQCAMEDMRNRQAMSTPLVRRLSEHARTTPRSLDEWANDAERLLREARDKIENLEAQVASLKNQ